MCWVLLPGSEHAGAHPAAFLSLWLSSTVTMDVKMPFWAGQDGWTIPRTFLNCKICSFSCSAADLLYGRESLNSEVAKKKEKKKLPPSPGVLSDYTVALVLKNLIAPQAHLCRVVCSNESFLRRRSKGMITLARELAV